MTLEQEMETHRSALTGYCYRMIGSGSEAEDAVQETMVRAWKAADKLQARGALKAWLFRIANNVCLDMLQSAQRRAQPMDLGPSSDAGRAARRAAGRERLGAADRRRGVLLAGGRPGRAWRPSGRRCGWRSWPRCSTCRRASARC